MQYLNQARGAPQYGGSGRSSGNAEKTSKLIRFSSLPTLAPADSKAGEQLKGRECNFNRLVARTRTWADNVPFEQNDAKHVDLKAMVGEQHDFPVPTCLVMGCGIPASATSVRMLVCPCVGGTDPSLVPIEDDLASCAE